MSTFDDTDDVCYIITGDGYYHELCIIKGEWFVYDSSIIEWLPATEENLF